MYTYSIKTKRTADADDDSQSRQQRQNIVAGIFYKPCDCRTSTKNNYLLYRFVQLFTPAAKTLFHTAGAQKPRPSLF